jgi:hypothetical protein
MPEKTKETPEAPKPIDPGRDVGNYLITVVGEDGKTVLRRLIANKCTVRIAALGEQSTCAEIK